MAQVNFYKYNTTTSLQENKSNIEEGSIVFDNEAKILYLVTKANTLEPYYGTDTKYSFSSSNNVLTITPSSGNSYNLTIDNVSHAGLADSATKAINDSEGNNISTTYLKNTGGIVSGTLEVDDLVVGNFLVKGSARFLNEIQGIIQYATKLGDDKSNLTVDNILSYLGSKVDRTTKIIAGNGLTGGGSLDSSITISHADTSDQSSVDGGTTKYIKSVALDDYGHVRGMSLADLPTNIASADLAKRAKYADAIRDPEYHDSSKRRSDINVTYNDGALHYFIGTSGCTGTTGYESFILHAAWDNAEWNTQLALPRDINQGIKWRYDNSGTWSNWYDVIDSKNWASFIGTETNPVNWANNATNATNAGKATTAENALKLNNFSQGFSNGFIPTYVEFPWHGGLVALGYNTSENSTNDYYYFLGLLKWAYNKYKNNGDILLIGNAMPNYTGNCQIQIYSSSPANNNGIPQYSSGLYESLVGILYTFGTNDYNYYFNQIDANNANYATLAATATIANSIKTEEGTANGDRPVFFGYLGDNTKLVYSSAFQYNPYTKNLIVENINGGSPITSVNIGSQRVAEAVLADSANIATNAGTANIATTANSLNFGEVSNLDSAISSSTDFKVYKCAANNSVSGADGFLQSFTWDSSGGYGAQIYVDCDPTGIMALRQRDGSGTWTNWKYLIHSYNWNEYIGTNTNPVELANVAKTAQSVAWNAITGIPNLVTIDTSQTISGNKAFSNTTTLDDVIIGNALVNGNARFLNQITGNLKGDVEGNASTATLASVASLVAHSLKVGSKIYNGSSDITITPKDLGLSGAMRFIGSTTTAISEGSITNPITINGASITAINGDVVLYNHVEFIWVGSWEQLGDEQSYALKSIQIKSGEGLSGGGSISNDVTLSHYIPTSSSSTVGVADKAISTLSIDKFGHIVSSSTISIPTKLSDLTPDISNIYLPTAGGNMKAGARISASDGYLYIGNENNNGWLCFQDICSQSSPGDGIWSIKTNGSAIFQTVKSGTITATTSITSPEFYGHLNGNADTSTVSGNTQKFNNYTLSQLKPVFYGRDFTNGTLIKTDIEFKVGVNNPFFLRIYGNGYGQGIINLEVQGYIYTGNATTIENVEIANVSANNYSTNNFSYIYIQSIDEKLCFWFPRLGYWHGYNAYCTYEYGDIVNHVVSITDVSKPDSPNELKVIPTYAINSENISRQSVSSALTAGSATSDGEGNNIANTYFKIAGGSVNGPVSLQSTIGLNAGKNIFLRNDSTEWSSGIFQDSRSSESVSIWAKNSATSFRWNAGIDMSSGAAGSMMDITPDFSISKNGSTVTGKISGNIIWHSGNLTSLSQLANDLGYITEARYLKYIDTRDENPTPYKSTYAGISYHLKINSVIGLTGESYSGLLNLRPWDDSSGGKEYQLAFTNGDINYRYGESEWSAWTKLITTNNISSYTAGSATTAGQLSSTRKIWGNDFNGTQNINGDISYTGSLASGSMIRFLDNTADSYGNGISIGGGGITILGAGESAYDIQGRYNSGNEDLILCSDEWIGMFPGQQNGYNDSKASYFHANGAVSILCTTASYALSVNGDTNFIGASIIGSTLDVASNITSGNQIKGKTINIDSKCTIKYDDTDKCIKFVFA